MDFSKHRTTELQATMLTVLQKVRDWELEWKAAQTAEKRMAAFVSWEGALQAKAALKAELKARGVDDFDWTAPKPPRRLP